MDNQRLEEKIIEMVKEHLKKAGIEDKYKISEVVSPYEDTRYLQVEIPENAMKVGINMDRLKKILETHQDMEEVFAEVDHIAKMTTREGKMDDLFNYDKIKEKLFIRVQNTKNARRHLTDRIYTQKADLAITYHAVVKMNESGITSLVIGENELEAYHITKEQLHEDAMRNAAKIFPCKVFDQEECIEACLHEGDTVSELMKDPGSVTMTPGRFLVVTNEKQMGGAAALFYPGVMEKLAESARGNYYILPSSTDEVLVLPDDGTMNFEMLNALVQTVNREMVSEDIFLGNEAYYYDAKNMIFDKASNFSHLLKQDQVQDFAGVFSQQM